MAKEKTAEELAELAAEQGKNAAKNVGRAAQEAVGDILPSPQAAISLSLSVSQPVMLAAAGVASVYGGVKVAKRLKAAYETRKAEKAIEDGVKKVRRLRQDDDSDAA